MSLFCEKIPLKRKNYVAPPLVAAHAPPEVRAPHFGNPCIETLLNCQRIWVVPLDPRGVITISTKVIFVVYHICHLPLVVHIHTVVVGTWWNKPVENLIDFSSCVSLSRLVDLEFLSLVLAPDQVLWLISTWLIDLRLKKKKKKEVLRLRICEENDEVNKRISFTTRWPSVANLQLCL